MNRAEDYLASLRIKNDSFCKYVYDNLKIINCEANSNTSKILIRLPLLSQMMNASGSFDTGAIITLIDQFSSIAIAVVDDHYNVSVDLSTNFISQISNADEVEFEIICHSVGKRLAFTSTEVKANGKVIALGTHTKSMISSKWTNYKL